MTPIVERIRSSVNSRGRGSARRVVVRSFSARTWGPCIPRKLGTPVRLTTYAVFRYATKFARAEILYLHTIECRYA